MSWSVDVIPTGDLPPVSERVCSFCDCPGNICTSIKELGFQKLPHIKSPEEQKNALKAMILELNKGNNGVFNDTYMVRCDELWSNGRESQKQWQEILPYVHQGVGVPDYMKTYEAYTGYTGRHRMLEDAERFYLYLASGYIVQFEW